MEQSKYLSKDGEAIGAVAWRIFFGAASLLQQSCSHCSDAESAVVFLKDVINAKKGEPLYDLENYKKWLKIAISAVSPQEQVFQEVVQFLESKSLVALDVEVEQIYEVEHDGTENKSV